MNNGHRQAAPLEVNRTDLVDKSVVAMHNNGAACQQFMMT